MSGWTWDQNRGCWINGRYSITGEVARRVPPSQVQDFAVRHTGEELPPGAFPDRRTWQERFIEMWADVNRSTSRERREDT